jgi:type IV fimbrial biogenesis protein FimT
MNVFRSRNRGFTLIELIVTVAIVAILLGLAAPNFSIWTQNQQIRGAAESVRNGLQLARATSMNANVPVRFYFHDAATARPGWTVCYWDLATDNCINDPERYPQPVIQRKSSDEGTKNVGVGVTTVLTMTDPGAFGGALAPGAGLGTADGVTFGGLGRPTGPANANFVRADFRVPALSADERRLVAVITPSGGIRVCDPKLDSTKNPQGC